MSIRSERCFVRFAILLLTLVVGTTSRAQSIVSEAENLDLKTIEDECVVHREIRFRIEKFATGLKDKGHDELGKSFRDLAAKNQTAAEAIGEVCRNARTTIDAKDRPAFDRLFLRAKTEAATWAIEWKENSSRAIERYRATVALVEDLGECLGLVRLYIDDVSVLFVDAKLRHDLFGEVYEICDHAYSGAVTPQHRELFVEALDVLAGLDANYSKRQDWEQNVKQSRQRLEAARKKLEVLDRLAPLPEDVDAYLKEYAGFCGADDDYLPRWRAKVDAVNTLKAYVRERIDGALDAVALADVESKIEKLATEFVSEADPEVEHWRDALAGTAGMPKDLIDAISMFKDGATIEEISATAVPRLEIHAKTLSNPKVKLVAATYLAFAYTRMCEGKGDLEQYTWTGQKAYDLLRGTNRGIKEADLVLDVRLFRVSTRALGLYVECVSNRIAWSAARRIPARKGGADQFADRAKRAQDMLKTRRFAEERGFDGKTFLELAGLESG